MVDMGNGKYEMNQITVLPADHTFYENAANLIAESTKMVASTANTVICATNFEIGRRSYRKNRKGKIERNMGQL